MHHQKQIEPMTMTSENFQPNKFSFLVTGMLNKEFAEIIIEVEIFS